MNPMQTDWRTELQTALSELQAAVLAGAQPMENRIEHLRAARECIDNAIDAMEGEG